MTHADNSALRAQMEEATQGTRWVYGGQGLVFANAEVVGAPNDEFYDLFASVQNDEDGVYLVALVNAAPDLLAKAEAYDRVERLCVGTSRRVLPYQIRRALAIPATREETK